MMTLLLEGDNTKHGAGGLLKATAALEGMHGDNADQNAGVEGSIVVGQVLENSTAPAASTPKRKSIAT